MARFLLAYRLLLMIILTAFTAGCDGLKALNSSSGLTISGKVQLGPVSGATVNLHCLNSDGSRNSTAMATAITNANGLYKLDVDSIPACPLLIVASGGSYTEESDQTTVTLASSDELESIIGEVEDESEVETSVTALSHLAAKRYESLTGSVAPSSNEEVKQLVERAKEEIRQASGLPSDVDVTRVIPADPSAPDADSDSKGNRIALVLAGLSELATSSGKNSFQFSETLAEDVKDGVVDDSNWADLPTHISAWVAGPRNTGGFSMPILPIVPVAMPIPDPNSFPLPVTTLPAPYEVDPNYFSRPARIVINPVSSYVLAVGSPCMGPFLIQLRSRARGSASFSQETVLYVKITNAPLEANSAFSIHADSENCAANTNSIDSVTFSADQTEASVWIRTTNKHFAYPVDLTVFAPGRLPPNFLELHTGATSSAAAAVGKRAVRWQFPQRLIAGTCAGPFFLQTIDSRGVSATVTQALNVDVSHSYSRGNDLANGQLKFYSDADCTNAVTTAAVAINATTSSALYAKLPEGADVLGLSAEPQITDGSVIGHNAHGLHVLGLAAHLAVPPPSMVPTPINVTSVTRLRLYTQYSGTATIQDTIDFSSNTLRQVTSGSVTISTCDLNSTALSDFTDFVSTVGLCYYGAATGGCDYGPETSIDLIEGATGTSRILSAVDTCRYYTGFRDIVDFCAAARPLATAKIAAIYASKTNCR